MLKKNVIALLLWTPGQADSTVIQHDDCGTLSHSFTCGQPSVDVAVPHELDELFKADDGILVGVGLLKQRNDLRRVVSSSSGQHHHFLQGEGGVGQVGGWVWVGGGGGQKGLGASLNRAMTSAGSYPAAAASTTTS